MISFYTVNVVTTSKNDIMWCQQNKYSHCLVSYSRKGLHTLGFNVKIIATQKCWLEGTSVSYLVQALTWSVTIVSSSRSTNARKNNNHFKDVKLKPLVKEKKCMLSFQRDHQLEGQLDWPHCWGFLLPSPPEPSFLSHCISGSWHSS